MSAATTRTVIAMDPSKTTPRAATFAGAYAVTLDHSITGAAACALGSVRARHGRGIGKILTVASTTTTKVTL
jgi:hypothetical protein